MLRANDRTDDLGLARAGSRAPSRSDGRTPIGAEDRPARYSEISPPPSPLRLPPSAFTLVEMLVAMAITLVMMGAVVTLFANVSNSVRDRRATMEMSGQLRHARNMLQKDLQGATCPGLTWRRPEENEGYIEIIEGPYREGNASNLIDGNPSTGANWPPTASNPEIDHTTSILPSSNLPLADPKWVTDGAGLGDYDDILMLTVRNEREPFVGKLPAAIQDNGNNVFSFDRWGDATLESPLAEVVWYAVENPAEAENANGFFGEPGMRTIYRRTLLIAPWVNPYRYVESNGNVHESFKEPGGQTFVAQPGLLRILPRSVKLADADRAIASLIALQDRYDISARLEFDPLLDSPNGRWKIVANTLGDLTKRENRYEHHFYAPNPPAGFQPGRFYPFAAVSTGSGYSGGTANVIVVNDRELEAATPPSVNAVARANLGPAYGFNGTVGSFTVATAGKGYPARPFSYVAGASGTLATARVMLNDDGEVVRVLTGLVPLSGPRRGEDVMLSDALAFDLRVYDPNAPLFGVRDQPVTTNSETRVVLEPADPGWATAYASGDNMNGVVGAIGKNNSAAPVYPYVGTGAYVDLGYGFNTGKIGVSLYAPNYAAAYSSTNLPWFFAPALETQIAQAKGIPVTNPGALTDVYANQLAPGYAVYDTWSFHYENDGVNEDDDEIESGMWQRDNHNGAGTPLTDQGTNGLDDYGHYFDPVTKSVRPYIRNGPDDVGERETSPPYDKPLRGIQVILRVYERDSRQIRQVSVDQHFVPE